MLAILVALNRTVATLSAAACLSRRDIFVFAAIRSVVWLPSILADEADETDSPTSQRGR
jgi:hypothetical protein